MAKAYISADEETIWYDEILFDCTGSHSFCRKDDLDSEMDGRTPISLNEASEVLLDWVHDLESRARGLDVVAQEMVDDDEEPEEERSDPRLYTLEGRKGVFISVDGYTVNMADEDGPRVVVGGEIPPGAKPVGAIEALLGAIGR